MADTPAFYIDQPVQAGGTIAVTDEQFRHVKALRLSVGSRVLLLDGKGTNADAELLDLQRNSAVFSVLSANLDERQHGPYIAAALGVLDDRTRMEWAVEKATELGVREFIPMQTERSEGFVQIARLERIAIAALKQSQRSFLPTLSQPRSFADVISTAKEFDVVLICHEKVAAEQSLMITLQQAGASERILLLVGPEGGFSEAEIEVAKSSGAQVVSLGATRLRAETALLSALATIQSLVANSK